MKSFFLKVTLFTLLALSLNACKKKENNPSKSNTETKEKSQSKNYSQEELEVAKYELESSLLKVFRETNKKIREEEFGAKQLGIQMENIAGIDWKEKTHKKAFQKAGIPTKIEEFKTKFGKLEYLKFRKEILTQHKIEI